LEPDSAEIFQLAVVQSRRLLEALRTDLPPEGESGDQEFQAKIRENPEMAKPENAKRRHYGRRPKKEMQRTGFAGRG
jgi:hypothetical protein